MIQALCILLSVIIVSLGATFVAVRIMLAVNKWREEQDEE